MTDVSLAPADVPSPPAPSPSPMLSRPGAVAAADVDAPVAWHYGDPVVEQRRLEAGRGMSDLSHRGVIRISGTDRLTWLHSLTSQHLSGLPPYTSAEALILSPHGHVEHDLHLVDDGEAVWITLEPGTVGAVMDWLTRMRFMLRVDPQDVTADWAVIGEPVDRETDPNQPGDPLAWRDPWPEIVAGGASYAVDASETVNPTNGQAREGDAANADAADADAADADAADADAANGDAADGDAGRPSGWAWREVLIPRPEFEQRAAAGEFDDAAGTWAVDALRVAAHRPRLGFETDHRTIPHEVDWLRTAVHLQKGCYRGQETVARVHNLGRPPRRLVLLHLDGSEHVLPEAGAQVWLGEKAVGRITTSARHHELGPIALAVIKRNTPLEAALTVDGIAAAQEAVVRG